MEKLRVSHKFLLLTAGIFMLAGLRPFVARQNARRGDDFARLSLFDDAIRHYKKALFLVDTYTYAYNQLALAYETVGKNEEAKAMLQKSIALNPDNFDGYMQLGRMYGQKQQYAEAERYFKEAFRLRPDDVLVKVWLEVCEKTKERR